MDVVRQAADLVATAEAGTVVWQHEDDRRVRRAQTAPFSRRDLGCWAAVVTGLDARYGLSRTFLDKVWPLTWQKRPTTAFDCSDLKRGDILQMHGYVSRTTQEDRFFLVTDNTDDFITLREVTVADVMKHFRG